MITGNAAGNALSGAGGDDRLVGGLGSDVLTGGPGNDEFVFRAPAETWAGPGRDVIRDFARSDRITLAQIDADAIADGDQAFAFIGDAAFSRTAGELRYRDGIVSGDLDGNGAADFEIGIANLADSRATPTSCSEPARAGGRPPRRPRRHRSPGMGDAYARPSSRSSGIAPTRIPSLNQSLIIKLRSGAGAGMYRASGEPSRAARPKRPLTFEHHKTTSAGARLSHAWQTAFERGLDMLDHFDRRSPDRPRARGRQFHPTIRGLAAGALMAALASCAPSATTTDIAAMLPSAAPDAGALPTAGFAAAVLPGQETRALLPNDTALAGENFILVRPAGRFAGQPTLARRLGALTPLPAPFEYAVAQDFQPVDGYGSPFSYIATEPSEGVTCALAVGATTSAAGTPATVMMRNCTRGDVTRALAPVASLAAY